jgi:hypothetical protein
MIKKLASFAFLLSILVSGCVKDATNPTDVVTVDITPYNSLVKKSVYRDSGTSNTIEYTYDSMQRLISSNTIYIFDSSKLPLVNTTYTKYIYSGNDTVPQSISYSAIFNSSSTPNKDTGVTIYTYNQQNQVIKDTGWASNSTSSEVRTNSASYSYSPNLNLRQAYNYDAKGKKYNFFIDSLILNNEIFVRYSRMTYSVDSNGNMYFNSLYSVDYTMSNYINPFYKFKLIPINRADNFTSKYYYASTITNSIYPSPSPYTTTNIFNSRIFTLDEYNRVVKIIETKSNGRIKTTTYSYY